MLWYVVVIDDAYGRERTFLSEPLSEYADGDKQAYVIGQKTLFLEQFNTLPSKTWH